VACLCQVAYANATVALGRHLIQFKGVEFQVHSTRKFMPYVQVSLLRRMTFNRFAELPELNYFTQTALIHRSKSSRQILRNSKWPQSSSESGLLPEN